MESVRNSVPAGLTRGFGGVVVIVLAAVALYYLYKYLYTSSGIEAAAIITQAVRADTSRNLPLYKIPPIYEGGEYSISFWAYVTGFKDQLGKNKHILEIRGSDFSTLVVGLGSFTNKLLVRVHTPGGGQTTGSGAAGSSDLTAAGVKKLFNDQDPGLLRDAMPLCDLPEVDLQRWVCVSVVLNGRTCDVYLDGKLARSCVLPSFFKVDKAVRMKLLDFGGFDGFLGDVTCYNYALNPEQAYRIYMTGPSDVAGGGILDWFKNIFDLKGTVTYKFPMAKIISEDGEYTF